MSSTSSTYDQKGRYIMAAYVKFVKPEHVEILNEYLVEEGVALIFPEAQAKAEARGLTDGQLIDYDFGGEADLFVEKVRADDHYFLNQC